MNVPKLRFKEFNDEYKNVSLNTLSKKITKKNKDNFIKNVISNSAIHGLISQRDFFDKDIANNDNTNNYFIIEKGDFVYNPRKSNEAPYGPINLYKFDEKGVISPLYLCFRTNHINNNYLEYYFKSSFWHRYIYLNGDSGARHDRVSIKDDTFFEMKINIPNESEQLNIANFLSLLDKKIELQTKKIEDLKLFKKGILNELVNDIIPEQKCKLSDLGESYSGVSGKTKEDFNCGESKYIPFMNVLKNSINIANLPNININSDEKQNKVFQGDLFFTVSSETKEEVGMCATLKYNVDNVYLNSFCFGFRINDKSVVDNEFLCYLLLSKKYRKIISNLGQGFTRVNISKNQLLDIEIELPNLDAQKKISKTISTLEKHISLECENLNNLIKLKKGLMQNMFV